MLAVSGPRPRATGDARMASGLPPRAACDEDDRPLPHDCSGGSRPASASMDGGEEGDGGAQPLERDRPDRLKADRLRGVAVGDDLVTDEDLPRSGVVGDPGRDVDGAAEVVAVLEDHRATVQADAGLRQADPGGGGAE